MYRNLRRLWDGRVKPFYVITDLDDYREDKEVNFVDAWWGFLEYIEIELMKR